MRGSFVQCWGRIVGAVLLALSVNAALAASSDGAPRQTPLAVAATVAPSTLDQRLAKAGLARGAPVLLRIFKEESELELWVRADTGYKRFATYPICRWTGVLGPKQVEGDRQSPEGFYSFGQDHLLWQGHWFRAVNLNFPNVLDQALGRTGSGLLIHGACSSIGCYAMTDVIIDEIFDLIVAGLANGQERVPVHIFPFHMTTANLDRHSDSPWIGFWHDLKPASDLFVVTHIPPRIGVCDGRYVVKPGVAGDAQIDRVRDWCPTPLVAGAADRLEPVMEARRDAAAPPEVIPSVRPPSERIKLYAKLASAGQIPKPKLLPGKPSSYGPSPDVGTSEAAAALPEALASLPDGERAAFLGVRSPGQGPASGSGGAGEAAAPANTCNQALAACRHFVAGAGALRRNKIAKR